MEVEKIVPVGEIDPADVDLPHIYVDRLVLGGEYNKSFSHERYSHKHEGG